MKKVVINYACGAWYPKGQKRLGESLKHHEPDVDFIGIRNYETIKSPPHNVVPYAFKTHCLSYCLRKGYDMAIYADASIFAVKPWSQVWEKVSKDGYYFENAGHMAGTWTKDSVLKKYGITRDEAMNIPMYSAGFTALDFRNTKAVEFLEKWHEASTDGDSFIGKWSNKDKSMSQDIRCKGHRHDMSVASILAHKLNMPFGRGGTFLSYIGEPYGKPSPTSCAHLMGA